jgi:hypothetical protein
MNESIDNLEIRINILCNIEIEKIDLFNKILFEHISYLGQADVSTLKEIVITEDEDVVPKINSLIKSVEPSMFYTPRDQTDSNAVTVPIETDGKLNCFIVISKKYLITLTPEFNHPIKTVSMLLEELLHVKIYTYLWGKRGYIQHVRKGLGIYRSGILTISSSMIDEYIVGRTKTNIFSTYNSFQLESGTDLIGGKINYGGNVFDQINTAEIELKKIVEKLVREAVSIPDAWGDISRILYRNIFEPLARNSAYYDENHEDFDEKRLESIRIYRDVVITYWGKIHNQLKAIYESNLLEYESALSEIGDNISALLERIGITCLKVQGEDCLIKIDSIILDILNK